MTHIALLRGVNVGGRNRIAMSELAKMFTDLGFTDTRTLLQSGNVVFNGGTRPGAELEGLLEAEMEKRFKLRIDFFVRTASEWRKIVAANPLPREAQLDPSHLLVMFLKTPPTQGSVKALQIALTGPEILRSGGHQVYIAYPAGIGKSKLTPALLEKTLGRGTGRNWNTVLKLQALTRP